MDTLAEQQAHYKAVKERIKAAAVKPKSLPVPEPQPEPEPDIEVQVTPEVTGVEEFVESEEAVTKPSPFRHSTIMREVANKHQITKQELIGPARTKRFVAARNEVSFRLRYELGLSTPRIGLLLGDRDHTTIMHAIRSYESQFNRIIVETMKMNAPTAMVQINTRVEQYIALRDKIRSLEEEQKETLKPYKDTLEKLGAVILAHLNETGVESVRTNAGSAYLTPKKSATLADAKAFFDYCKSNDAWDLMDRKANVTAVGDFVEEHGAAPPGVNYSVELKVGVRRK